MCTKSWLLVWCECAYGCAILQTIQLLLFAVWNSMTSILFILRSSSLDQDRCLSCPKFHGTCATFIGSFQVNVNQNWVEQIKVKTCDAFRFPVSLLETLRVFFPRCFKYVRCASPSDDLTMMTMIGCAQCISKDDFKVKNLCPAEMVYSNKRIDKPQIQRVQGGVVVLLNLFLQKEPKNDTVWQ